MLQTLTSNNSFTTVEHSLAEGWAMCAGWDLEIDRVADSGAERLWLSPRSGERGAVYTITRCASGFVTTLVTDQSHMSVHAVLREALRSLMPLPPMAEEVASAVCLWPPRRPI